MYSLIWHIRRATGIPLRFKLGHMVIPVVFNTVIFPCDISANRRVRKHPHHQPNNTLAFTLIKLNHLVEKLTAFPGNPGGPSLPCKE